MRIKERLCNICGTHPAIIEIEPCRLDETDEHEQWLTADMNLDYDEVAFAALQATIDKMREKLEIARNKSNWEGNFRIFTKTTIYPCIACQEDQKKQHYLKTILPKHLAEAGVKKIYLSAELNNCGSWLKEYTDKSLFLHGAVGIGKTYAAVALLRYDIEHTKHAVFVSIFDLLQKIKASFSQTAGQTEQQIIEYYSTIPNLYLDDLSAEKPTDWGLTILCSVLDARYSNQLRTIITSNADIPDLQHILGDRLISRIIGICGSSKKLTGKDRRLPD